MSNPCIDKPVNLRKNLKNYNRPTGAKNPESYTDLYCFVKASHKLDLIQTIRK